MGKHVAYLTQTYNNLLRDTEVNELAGQITLLMDKVKKLQSKHQ
jgi:polyhydroxyalkanoate synthesis regulator phasin